MIEQEIIDLGLKCDILDHSYRLTFNYIDGKSITFLYFCSYSKNHYEYFGTTIQHQDLTRDQFIKYINHCKSYIRTKKINSILC